MDRASFVANNLGVTNEILEQTLDRYISTGAHLTLTHIQLIGNRITELPSSIGRFPYLQSLDLRANGGLVNLPVELAQCSCLQVLKLPSSIDERFHGCTTCIATPLQFSASQMFRDTQQCLSLLGEQPPFELDISHSVLHCFTLGCDFTTMDIISLIMLVTKNINMVQAPHQATFLHDLKERIQTNCPQMNRIMSVARLLDFLSREPNPFVAKLLHNFTNTIAKFNIDIFRYYWPPTNPDLSSDQLAASLFGLPVEKKAQLPRASTETVNHMLSEQQQ